MGLFDRNPNESAYVGGKKHWTDVIKNSGPGDLLIWRNPRKILTRIVPSSLCLEKRQYSSRAERLNKLLTTVHTNYPRKTTRLFLVCAMRFPAVLVPSTVLYTLFVRHTVWRFSGVRIPPSKYGILSCKLLPACRLVAPIRYK